jgi:hypothetical protein
MGDHLPRGASPTYWRRADAAGVFQANSHEAAATLLKMKRLYLDFHANCHGVAHHLTDNERLSRDFHANDSVTKGFDERVAP